MLKIGFPKGNIKRKSLAVISQILGNEIDKEKLYFSDEKNYHFYMLKNRDLPLLLQSGQIDCAIVATEWLKEKRSKFPILYDLGWSKYRICLIVSNSKPFDQHLGPKTCVTEYPLIAKQYLLSKGWNQTVLSVVSGSSECFVPSIYDCCIDCVETGATLKRHNLIELDTLFESSVVLVTRNDQIKLDNQLLNAIMMA